MKYIALDFETAYWGPANACSLGIVTSDGHEVIVCNRSPKPIDEMKSDGGSGTKELPAGKKTLALGRG